MKRLAFAASILYFTLFSACSVSALTIDEFNDGGLVNSAVVDDVTTQDTKSIVSNSAVGGRRTILLSRTAGPVGGSASIYSNTKLYHSQGSGVRALSILTWDGDADATNAVKGNGLGNINLLQDNTASKILIQVFSFDYANQTSADITLRLYDSSSPSGQKYSDVSVTLDRVVNNFTIEIPFSYFSTLGNSTIPAPFDASKPLASQNVFSTNTAFALGNNKVDIQHVGAIQFSINGQNGDSDLAVDFIKTDGRCSSVPNSSGTVIDGCGVCLEDTANVQLPNGKRDRCNVCLVNPSISGYDYNASKVFDSCNLCPGETNYNFPSGTKDRCNICLSGPAPYNYNSAKTLDACNLCPGETNYKAGSGSKDSCGVCLSGPSPYVYQSVQDSCGLCPSAPNYTVAKDPCNVCFGDGSSCADCSGTPNGSKKIDICGVCGGNGTTCLDCSGVPFGTKGLDACGVCGGDGKSCLDCAGVIFGTSKVDACGTCGGSITDSTQCVVDRQCITVQATSDILAFEKRLVTQTKTITKKYKDEESRGKRNKCGINTKPSTKRVDSAYSTITAKGKDIFTKGVEICGTDCVTVSFADQVQALAPQLKIIESETTTLAKKVQACYKKKKIKVTNGVAGVATTIKNVQKDLTQLVKDCQDKQVCPH